MTLFDLAAKITLDTNSYESGLANAESKTTSFGGKLKTALGTAGKIGAAAIGAATTAVTAFAGKSVQAGQEFDKSMSQVAATLGQTMEEMATSVGTAQTAFGEFHGNLRDFAQFMGANTAFSATQAAEALNYMALAGYDTQKSMDMLPTVLNLAASGNMELALASDMVTDAQSALGLTMEETATMVDEWAKAASKSNTSVTQLGDAILTIGGTASYMSGGTDRLATVLGVLADNGIKGSEAGTHLRNMILSLSAPTDKGAATIEQLGLSIYDADGKMRDFQDIFLDLNAAMQDMTDEEKISAFSELFNTRDIAAATALLNTTGDRWEELGSAIADAGGAAQAMADTQLDNLAGDITLFKSALEGAQIAVSDKLTPTLREFVQFGSNSISTLTDAFKNEGLSGAMGALGKILSDGISMIIGMLPQLIKAGAELLKALVDGIVENLPALTEAAIEIIMMLAESLIEYAPQLVDAITQVIIKIAELLTDPDMLVKLIDVGLTLILTLAQSLIDNAVKIYEKMPEIIDRLTKALVERGPQIVETGIKLIVALVEGLIKAIPKIAEAAIKIVSGFLQACGSMFSKIIQLGSQIIDKVKDGIKQKINDAKKWGQDLIDNFVQGIKDKIQKVKDAVSKVANTVKDFLGFSEPELGPLSNFHTYAPDMMKLFAQGIRDNERLITDQISKSFNFGERITAFGGKTGNWSGIREAEISDPVQPIQLVLDGRVISETVLRYDRSRKRMAGV